MAVFRCAINVLRTHKQGFDYNFHNRVEPGTAGLYAFWLDTGACLYVGESEDIGRRMYQHRFAQHNPDLRRFLKAFAQRIEVSYYTLQGSSQADRRQLERRLIDALRAFTNG